MEITTELRLANDARADLEPIDTTAVVDAGRMHVCIPAYLARRLQLKDRGIREVLLADGQARQVRYVSPLRIEILGRVCVTGALVLGNQVLLGAIPMEDMDLIVKPAGRQVAVNPMAPNVPMSRA